MRCVAIIPARGGSKRIPGKNIKPFLGKPIIAYSIIAALESGLFEHVIVSTDDAEIAAEAKKYGAEIPFIRPKNLADDFTGTADVVDHCLCWLRDQGVEVDYSCCIYATAPFVQIQYLKEGLDVLLSSGKDHAYSVTSFPFPIQRAVNIVNGEVQPLSVVDTQKRSQDLLEAFHDAGQFYWQKVACSEYGPEFPVGALPVVLPRFLVQDIDTEEDWQRAEIMYEVLQKRGLLK